MAARNLSPQSAALFGAGFFLAGAVLFITALASFIEGFGLEPGDDALLYILIANAGVVLGLGTLVVFRVVRRVRGRRFGEPAPRIHLRFVTLFSLAAVVPALLTAIFLGALLTRGVDYWFGARVNSVLDGLQLTGEEFYRGLADEATGDAFVMKTLLQDEGAVDGFTNSRITYVRYLRELTARGGFEAAYIVDGRGTVLARANFGEEEIYYPPTPSQFEEANEGFVSVNTPWTRDEPDDRLRLLYRLDGYDDAYLYVAREANLPMLRQVGDARRAFDAAASQESRTRAAFFLIYGEVAALILIGAIWLGLSAANRVASPISRLVGAAERVRQGDLEARVQHGREDDEIAALGRAFNRMTRQLGAQRRELIESHAQSEQRRAFIEAVLAGVSAGVIGVDGDNRITLINRSAVAMMGAPSEDLIGRDADEAAPELTELLEEARRRPGLVAEAQIDWSGADGQVRYLNARAAMDEEAGLVVTFDDVTRLVAAQRNAAWRDVARRIAHEIKNPLTPIQLSAERLKRKYRKDIAEDVETFDRCTDTIVRQVSDIGRMVDEFSSFARMPQPKVEPVELGELAQASVFAQRVANPRIRFSYDRPVEAIRALCDARLSGQALTNILKNAGESVTTRMDRDGEGGPDGQIRVEVREEVGFAVIEVSDNGLGWPVADRERLTEPYMTTREKGTGLGLAIVKRVMEDHKGRLELGVPADGQGAVVRLVFPLQDSDAVDEAAKEEA